ncbi:MAG: exosortase/archaeosortase family protein [Verrucomicrobia bacterium]|nr:exosortase/archaeosortase family protein [Verrucomicrobiota bacterium]
MAGYWLLLVYQLGAQWSAYEQYNYGWAVPLLGAYLFWLRFGTRPPAETPRRTGLALAVVGLAALLFLPTRLLHEANPVWRLTSLLWTLEIISLTLAMLYLVGGVRWLRHFAFPVAFFVVAVPWPSGLESQLIQTLTRWNTTTTIEILGLLGVPAVQHGNVIEISTGVVGVDEACSGIRSFQATLMIALFLGEMYALSLPRRVVCLVAGFALSFLFNVGRTGLLTWVAARDGVAAIDKWHDPAGVTILVGCFIGLWLTGLWLRKGQDGGEGGGGGKPNAGLPTTGAEHHDASVSPSMSRLRAVAVPAIALLVWLVLVEVGVEIWYRSHEIRAASAQSWTVRWPEERPAFRWIELSDSVKRQIFFESGGQCAWPEADGSYWQLLYFRWQPSRSLYPRVRSHLNKTHRPEHCLSAGGMRLVADLGLGTYRVGNTSYSLGRYVFEANGQVLRVFYGQYEDSAAPEFVTSYRENTARRVAAVLAGSRNYGLRMLEIAVAGIPDEAAAEAALQAQLEKLIVIGDESGSERMNDQ